MNIGKYVTDWYLVNKRSLPWRESTDPYIIWISEIILQQTRVNQGLSYFFSFINVFPDVKTLAAADISDVLKIWQGLGYYSRARNMHQAAKTVVDDYNGIFPDSYSELIKLKGVGEYTAAAVASISSGEKVPVVDGNVYRLLARFYGIDSPVNTNASKKEFASVMLELMNNFEPGLFNQAIMEFGALQCVPVNPECNKCPLVSNCYAYDNKKIDVLPVKLKKKKIRNRFFFYIVIITGNHVLLKKRLAGDIWEGLYEFPVIETDDYITFEQLTMKNTWKNIFGEREFSVVNVSEKFIHQLTHQRIFAQFAQIYLYEPGNIDIPGTVFVNQVDLEKYPVSRLIEKYFETVRIFNYGNN